jgi:hypothetical protein
MVGSAELAEYTVLRLLWPGSQEEQLNNSGAGVVTQFREE